MKRMIVLLSLFVFSFESGAVGYNGGGTRSRISNAIQRVNDGVKISADNLQKAAANKP